MKEPVNKEIKLPAKWMSQRDSHTSQGGRMCDSTTHTMFAHFLAAGRIHGPYAQADDNWLTQYVEKYGDTTDPHAQIRALKDIGVNAVFCENLGVSKVTEQLEKGIPVPIAVLIHDELGNLDPEAGHWMLIVGINAARTHFYVHDPAGELDLIGGGYHITNKGEYRVYSIANLSKRWEVSSDGRKHMPGHGWGTLLVSVDKNWKPGK